MLTIRVLGEIAVSRGDEHVELPPSKKTRALLAYLAVTGRPHRRDRLCSLFWDVADDPRGALRWSLSKLRGVVDEPDCRRLVTDGTSVAFHPDGVFVDLLEIRRQLAGGLESIATERLAALAGEFGGEFLEGLELSDFHDFQAWCVAHREQARSEQATVLRALVDRLSSRPEDALVYARDLVQVDPLSESARVALLRLLAKTGRPREAEQQYQAAKRLLKELGSEPSPELARALAEPNHAPVPAAGSATPVHMVVEPERVESQPTRLVGRQAERARLSLAVDEAGTQRREQVLLITGEPGMGKTRLLAEMRTTVEGRGGTILEGCAYEAESGRPYGPWIDALRCLPPVSVGKTLGTDLSLLLPELVGDSGTEHSRDRLFGAVSDLIAARAHSAPPVLLAFDDVHWLDEASASLLHYVIRMNRHRPVAIALAAREGELPDNEPILRIIRRLRREHWLDELKLEPLGASETEELVKEIVQDVDVQRVFEESAGNPLYALEVARSLPYRRDDVPQTLTELVRDRIDRLPPEAGDVLRWGAVLSRPFSVEWLSELTAIDLDALVSSLETLERRALIRAEQGAQEARNGYDFAHQIVRRAVYGDISAPRRRLMHLRIAKTLLERGGGDETAVDIAHHAALAGEASMAARACVAAGRLCLRLFANVEADALASRGMRHAEELGEPEKVKLMLELSHIRLVAKRPSELEETAERIEELAERALEQGCLEHARLGFHLLSYLRWEGGDWSDAQRHTMRAELVSRSADEKERVVAMAEAARCLALLERDLPHAEALVLEASARSSRIGLQPTAVPDAVGMLRLHQGKLEEAYRNFQSARALSHRQGDRLGEFQALEHLVTLELQRERYQEAFDLAKELVTLGDKLRGGSEAPFARALAELCRYAMGEDDALAGLEEALEDLRVADAKHRLAYILTRTADMDLRRGRAEIAGRRASEGLRIAKLLGRPSEIAMAQVALARAASQLADGRSFEEQIRELSEVSLGGISSHVRESVRRLVDEFGASSRRNAGAH